MKWNCGEIEVGSLKLHKYSSGTKMAARGERDSLSLLCMARYTHCWWSELAIFQNYVTILCFLRVKNGRRVGKALDQIEIVLNLHHPAQFVVSPIRKICSPWCS